MITGQLSKPLLSLRSDMSAAELRADDKAATPESDLNDEPLLLPSEATDREGTPNKLYGESTFISVSSSAANMPAYFWLRSTLSGKADLQEMGQVEETKRMNE